MGPDNPWSPDWRPDPSGGRLRTIRAARRGALVGGLVYLGVGVSVVVRSPLSESIALAALLVGLPGVALLGAGLAPSTLGSRIDAVVAGIAFAIGAPVAAVTSILIGAFIFGAFVPGSDLAGPILRGGVIAAIEVFPLVVVAASIWVLVVRRAAGRPVPSTERRDPTEVPDTKH